MAAAAAVAAVAVLLAVFGMERKVCVAEAGAVKVADMRTGRGVIVVVVVLVWMNDWSDEE